jgi:hydrogenase nickel incorporation protein HypB
MTIEIIRQRILRKNEQAAEMNRLRLDDRCVVAVNMMGGAGCGKTTLLESIIPRLTPFVRVGVLEGDLATTKDAERIARLGVPVVQLLTEGGCHLTATLVEQGLSRLPLDELDLLIIENVGNPICPANFDLGEHFRIAVLSVTEGDDKPTKYPYLFTVADLVVISKTDLLASTDFDPEAAIAAIHALDPAKTIEQVSARDPESTRGIVAWLLNHVPADLTGSQSHQPVGFAR